MPLKVLTFNIAHGAPFLVPAPFLRPPGSLRRTLDGVAALLVHEAADVVALQEVDRKCLFSGGVDQVAHIAEQAGYAHVLHGVHLRVPGVFAQGTALLSRHPLHEPEVGLFQGDRAVDKGFVVASIHWEGHDVDMVSVHLDPFSPQRRQRQARRLAEALERRHRPGRLRVLMGDLNSSEGNPGATVERLCEAARLRSYEPGAGGPTYTTTRPRQRLDWILVSPELRYLHHARVHSVLSDHFPVVAELDWAGSPQG
ncbi:endonuclease/exonuclease/phosphatase family protein [Pyxidicoccus sp. 3LG]